MDEKFLKARALARLAKKRLRPQLFQDRNMAGAGFGRKVVGDREPEGPALVVYVMKKLPASEVPPSLLLPKKVYVGNDAIDIDVVETGPFYTQAFTAKERPAPSGISVGHPDVSAGTLGCLVEDNTDGSLCILSNNHVLADANAASSGDATLQPGAGDGGSAPGDVIGKLKRFVTVDCSGTNQVDGAISEVGDDTDVVAQFKNNLMPYPGPDHPAVGLLFAGSPARTLLNPIDQVIRQLDISFLAGSGAVGEAELEMAVEKVGRTTEYTTGQVTEIDVTASVGTYECGSATFEDQIATCPMSCGGDSGSVVCEGGSGECEDMDCGCGTSTTAARVFGVDVSLDRAVEKEFRQRYLGRTLVGRYAIDLYFLNERTFVRRFETALREEGKKEEEHVEFGRHLYEKYAADLREAMLQPDRSDLRLTSEHLEQAREVLGRAKQHMSREEVRAAEELLELAQEAVGKNVREILEMLDSEELHERVVRIVSSVPSIEEPGCDCC